MAGNPKQPPMLAIIATAIIGAADLQTAFDVAVSEVFRALGIRALMLEEREGGWTCVAGTLSESAGRDWPPLLGALSPGTPLLFHDPVAGPATAISLTGPAGPGVAMVLEGEWTAAQDALNVWSLVMSFALHSGRERDAKRNAERLMVDGYAMARRLSRLGGVDSVAQRVVEHVARVLKADRVSVALYHPTEDSLTIAAACGYPLSSVKDVRIQPGAWVIGHVQTSGRPIFVRDVRLVRGMPRNRHQYRTFSFAAVPMFAGSETVGVLTVTDKRDGSAFDRLDEMVLRTMSVAAAVALVAARTDSEVTRLAHAATMDSLTGLLNRPYLDARLHQEVERAKREVNVLAVLMADIDDFKTINDTCGHQVGDAVLQTVGGVIRSAVRVFDVCARYGGDEFAILMPNSDHKSAVACAERIRLRVAEQEYGSALPRLTMSIGVAVIRPGDAASDLLLRADQCLYQAKADGKNLVHAQASVPSPSPEPRSGLNGHEDSAPCLEPNTSSAGVRDEPAWQADVPYVLVADANPERAAVCLASIKPFGIGLLIARDGDQAARVLERFGPPILLIVDLSLPTNGGFGIIETLRGDPDVRTEIIAWSASRDVREFAAARLAGLNVRVLGSVTPQSIMRAAIERALHRRARAPTTPDAASALTPEELHQLMADLSDRARQLTGAPGVAIYMRTPGSTPFRASFTWTSDDMIPHSPHHLPHVFSRIQESGDVMVIPDPANRRSPDDVAGEQDAVKGLVAVPVVGTDEQILGAICVFDIKPLTLDDVEISALKAIGRGAIPAKPAHAMTAEHASDGGAPPAKDARRQDAPPPIVDWPPALLDRTGGEFAVARELARARREQRQLSVVLFDISPAGQAQARRAPSTEDLLESVAQTLLRAIRQSDLPIRWGGSELLVVLPGLASAEARSVAERVRAALQAGSSHRVAVSGGVAELESKDTFGAVVDRARQKVEQALQRGHNRVI